MLTVIGQALFFFLPSYVGNAAPVLLDRLGVWKGLAKPVDGGKNLGGEPIFGRTKTWRGVIGGSAAGIIVAALQAALYASLPEIHVWFLFPYEFPNVLVLGFLLGFGESLGDLIKSFVKRRLHIQSSAPFFPFDQMSFLGALLLGSFYYLPSMEHIFAIIFFSLLIPVISNFLAYKWGWKKVPW